MYLLICIFVVLLLLGLWRLDCKLDDFIEEFTELPFNDHEDN